MKGEEEVRNACKVEIKRAFQSTAMKIIIIIGALLAVWHTVDTYKSWQEYLQIREQYTSPLFSMRSLYTELMMMNGNEIQYVLFHNLLRCLLHFRLLFRIMQIEKTDIRKIFM